MEEKLKVFYDAEFTGLHKNTTPISIGLVSESGAYFYAEFTDYDTSQVTDWIEENVIQNLKLGYMKDGECSGTKFDGSMVTVISSNVNMLVKGNTELIKSQLMGWLSNESACADGIQIQFFTDCYAYDWIIMNDLIGLHGSALEIPTYVNYIPIDLSTALYLEGDDPDISREEYIGDFELNAVRNQMPKIFGTSNKHNCLYDAYVCRQCFRHWML